MKPGRTTDTPTPCRPKILTDPQRKAAHPELGGRVQRGGRRRRLAGQRRDEHHVAAAPSDHPWCQSAGQSDRRAQIDLQHVVDPLLVEVGEQSARGVGRRWPRGCPPRPPRRAAARRPGGSARSHTIACPETSSASARERLGPAPGQDQLGTTRGKRARDRVTDPAGGAGKEHSAVETRHRRASQPRRAVHRRCTILGPCRGRR